MKKIVQVNTMEEALEELRVNGGYKIEFSLDFYVWAYKADVWNHTSETLVGEKRKLDQKTEISYWSYLYLEDMSGTRTKVPKQVSYESNSTKI